MFGAENLNPKDYSPVALAYIGDSVYDLFVRGKIMEKGNRHVTDMHKDAIGAVSAAAQAKSVHNIEKFLTEEEQSILKWGRNAKSGGVPKNASVVDYRWATGFETLVGYLYLDNRLQRLEEILTLAYLNKEDKK